MEDVLGVALAVTRAVEAAGEDLVVGDDRLRVHVVVDGALGVGRRALAGKARRDRLPRPDLPVVGGDRAPCGHDLFHLRRVVGAGHIERRPPGELGERPQDGARGHDRRQDPDTSPRGPEPLGDEMRERRPLRREERTDRDAALQRRDRAGAAARLDPAVRPQLLEVTRVIVRDRRGPHTDHRVLLTGEGVVRPIRGTGPHGGAVAHDVLVVHQRAHVVDAPRRDLEAVDLLRARSHRSWCRGVTRALHVERHPDRDPSRRSRLKRVGDPRARPFARVEVVDRDVDRSRRRGDERDQRRRHRLGGLTAVGQEVGLERAHDTCAHSRR